MIRVEKPPLSTLVLVHRMPFLRVNAIIGIKHRKPVGNQVRVWLCCWKDLFNPNQMCRKGVNILDECKGNICEG